MAGHPYPRDLRSLTGLRFLAALWVLVFHLGSYAEGLAGAVGRGSRGYLGVDFFFVLSGFILTHVYLAQWRAGAFSFRAFLWFRVARIWPLHLAVLAANVALFGALAVAGLAPRAVDWTQLPAVALLVHAWGVLDALDWNDPSWSVSAEWFAYLAFPAFLALAGVWRRQPALGVATTGLAFVAAFVAAPAVFGERLTQLTYDFGVARIVPEFALGSALYVLGESRPALRHGRALAVAAAAGVLGGVALGASDVLLVPLLAALIYGLADADRALARNPLQSKAAVYLGEISYGVYLAHFVVFYAWFGAVKVGLGHAPGEVPWPIALGPVPLVLGAAVAGYHLVEVPARRWIRAVAG